jgi:hypothetical protein
MVEAARACSNQRRALIGSWVTPHATGAIKIERGGDENRTINHIGGDDGGDGGDGRGSESDGGVGGGRTSSLSTAAVTGAAKT